MILALWPKTILAQCRDLLSHTDRQTIDKLTILRDTWRSWTLTLCTYDSILLFTYLCYAFYTAPGREVLQYSTLCLRPSRLTHSFEMLFVFYSRARAKLKLIFKRHFAFVVIQFILLMEYEAKIIQICIYIYKNYHIDEYQRIPNIYWTIQT